MEKVHITLPETWLFETVLPVRIGDINYGNHLANDAVLRLAHEVRLQFLTAHHYSEMNIENTGLIMANAVIQFINQAGQKKSILNSEPGMKNLSLSSKVTLPTQNKLMKKWIQVYSKEN